MAPKAQFLILGLASNRALQGKQGKWPSSANGRKKTSIIRQSAAQFSVDWVILHRKHTQCGKLRGTSAESITSPVKVRYLASGSFW